MPIEHSKRLAWFRQLHRIIQFPRTFLAPKPPGLRRNHRVTDGFGSTLASTLDTASDWNAAAGSRHKSIVDAHAPKLTPERTTGSPIAGKLPVVAVNLPGAPKRVRAREPLRAIKPALNTLAGRTSAQSLKRYSPEAQTAVPLPPPLPDAEPSTIRSETPRSIADILPLSQPPRVFNLPSHLPHAPSHLGFDPMLRAQPPVADHAPAEEQFLDEKSRPDPITSNGASRDESGSRATRQTSTVHIDGSVLGRWAIQHLERALGRPPIGMTGVDPRASAPRSRVSPF
jgi:hypothetical protein